MPLSQLESSTLVPPPAAVRGLAHAGAEGRNRRSHERLTREDLAWLTAARLDGNAKVAVIDLSASGAQIETTAPLRPGSLATLTIVGRDVRETVSLSVLRCEVARLDRGLVYRGAGEFDRTLGILNRPSEAAEILRQMKESAGGPFRAPDEALAGAGWSRLVVRYLDGRLLKGFSQDFHPSRPHFHLSESMGEVSGAPVFIQVAHLKAVFFVRDFSGDPAYIERKSFVQPLPGRRIQITFLDDEVLVGATLGYRLDGTGFFLTPADPDGNNLRIYVLHSAIRHIRYL